MALDLARNASVLKNAYTLAYLAKAAYADDPAADAAFQETVFTAADSFSDDDTETSGFVTTNDDHLVVSFRGTQNVQNWLTDFKFVMRAEGGVYVHDGFAHAVDTVWTQVLALIKDHDGSSKTIWVTGHSLGGALANWSAFWLTGKFRPAGVFTFGQPRVGDKTFRADYDLPHHRFVNDVDIVPTVPSRLVPGHLAPPAFYTHVNTLHHFDQNGDLVEDSDEELGAQPALTDALGPLSRGEAAAARLVIQGLEDHKIDNYIWCLQRNQE
jgi:hypothetical protein